MAMPDPQRERQTEAQAQSLEVRKWPKPFVESLAKRDLTPNEWLTNRKAERSYTYRLLKSDEMYAPTPKAEKDKARIIAKLRFPPEIWLAKYPDRIDRMEIHGDGFIRKPPDTDQTTSGGVNQSASETPPDTDQTKSDPREKKPEPGQFEH